MDTRRYSDNLQDEINGAYLYRTAADLETDETISGVYRRLAETEEHHAELWAQKLREAGRAVGSLEPDLRTRTLARLARRFGVGVISQVMAATERTNRTVYDRQPEAAGTSLPADERAHAVILDALQEQSPGGVRGGVLARIETRHRVVGGNALRAAVLGANDGLVSNTALVMGVAGAAFSPDAVLLSGLAGLLAGAASMALGEWISVQSSRELHQAQIRSEREEIMAMPEEEAAELALIYQAKGMGAAEAERAARDVMSDPDAFLDTKAREELGIDPEELGGSAWEAAFTSFLLFAVGAVIPVVPFFFMEGFAAIATSMSVAAAGLFLLGSATAIVTGTGVLRTGIRSLVLGTAAAAATFGIGSALGVAVS